MGGASSLERTDQEVLPAEWPEIPILYSLPFLMTYSAPSFVAYLQGTAEGELYVDDGESYDYRAGAYIHRKFNLSDKKLTSTNIGSHGKSTSSYLKTMQDIRIERILVVGAPKKYAGKTVTVKQGGKEWTTSTSASATAGKAQVLTVRDPKVRIGEDWEIQF